MMEITEDVFLDYSKDIIEFAQKIRDDDTEKHYRDMLDGHEKAKNVCENGSSTLLIYFFDGKDVFFKYMTLYEVELEKQRNFESGIW